MNILIPNFRSVNTGVTATIIQLTRIQQSRMPVAIVGRLPVPDLPGISIIELLRTRNMRRVWHARRNMDLAVGLALKHLLGLNIAIVFTCSNPRKRTRTTMAMLNATDAIIGTSEKMQQCMPKPLARIIPHGIDLGRFSHGVSKSQSRQDLGLPDGFLIGCFGRVRPEKGTDILVDAALGLIREHPSVKVVILGRATGRYREYRDMLRGRIRAAGAEDNFIFRSEVPYDQVCRWYPALDLYVAVPRWEGFGLTVLEALASGVPVVASREGIFDQVVIPGKTGMIVDNDSPAQLHRTMHDMAKSLTAGNRSYAEVRNYIPERFTIEHEASTLADLYGKLLYGSADN